MEVRLLGQLEVLDGDGPVVIPAGKPRSLLVLLALHPNEPLDGDRIVDALWGESPPASAPATVQTYVSRLRKVLGADRIETVGHGYRLRLVDGERDVDRVVALRDRARLEPPVRAAASLREALTLYRGRALGEDADADFARGEAHRLDELRETLVAERIEADLAAGRHASVLNELESLVARRPLDERLRGLLMVALYRSGRQADALAAYRDGYRLLAEELGIEPSAELKALERRVLEHDSSLDIGDRRAPAPPTARHSQPAHAVQHVLRRRWKLVAGIAAYTAVLVAAGVAAGLALSDQESTSAASVPIVPDSVVAVDPRELRVVASIPVARQPRFVAATRDALWVAGTGDLELTRIDPSTFQRTQTIELGFEVTDLEPAGDSIWVCGGFGSELWRIDDAGRPRVKIDIQARFGPPPPGLDRSRAGLASSGEGLWLAYADRVVLLDPVTGRTIHVIDMPGGWFHDVDVGVNGLVESIEDGNVHSFDPVSYEVGRSIFTGRDVGAILLASGYGWIAKHRTQQIWQLHETDVALRRTVDVDGMPTSLAFHDDAIWVVTQGNAALHRVDAREGVVDAELGLAFTPEEIAVANDLLWIAVRST